MADPENIRTGRHRVFARHAHLVFLTKFRPNVFGDRHTSSGWRRSCGPCADFHSRAYPAGGCAKSSPTWVPHYYRANKPCSGSYLAGSAGRAPLSVVRQYIEQQNRPVQDTARALTALPARTLTPALKGGALARIPVAKGRRLPQDVLTLASHATDRKDRAEYAHHPAS